MSDDQESPDRPRRAPRGEVDWEALSHQAGSEADREWLQLARVVDDAAASVNPSMQQRAPGSASTVPPHAADVDPPKPSIGSWGKYLLRDKVGEGGFGAVFRAWDPLLEHEVAIKVLHRRVSDARLKDALLLEGRALARIDHPNVVRVLGMEVQDDQFALCMEFVQGETLEDLVRRQGTFNVREAAMIAEDVCRALAAVHNAGFVHRDVKARNVMRQKAGRIVLMDFGAGRHSRDLQMPGRIPNIGTPLYMAPEILAGESASEASDVYSVGVLLYFLVAGGYPVEGRSVDELRRAHLQGRRTALLQRCPDLPAPFAQAVERALAPDPAHRFKDAGGLLTALLARDIAAPRTAFSASTAAYIAGWAAAGLCGAGFLGTIINAAYNVTMERTPPFDHESIVMLVRWGQRALVAPALYVGVMLLVVGALRETARLVRIPASARAFAARLVPKTPAGVAHAAATAGLVGLCATVWRFRELLNACTTAGLVNAPREQFAPVEPGHVGPFFRLSLYVLITMFILVLLHLKSRERDLGTPAPRSATWTVVGMLTLTLILSAGPYRMLWGNKVERFEIGGERCYPLGTSQTEVQLFCPDRDPPRTRIVAIANPDLHRTGIIENLFTGASGAAKETTWR